MSRYKMLPYMREMFSQIGEQIKLARLRRRLPVALVAERAGISRATVWKIEKGDPSVSIGSYAYVLRALNGMEKDLLLIAKDEELKSKLDLIGIKTNKRAPRR
ncbi:MAG: helix-turn-helix domain-containing protein [Clostridia bacterium]|nr:helix-turn-helix domain-containing protein [Clostridia bacterium]